MTNTQAQYIVPALDRGLQILRLFSTKRHSITFTDVSKELGLSRATAYRLLYTLTERGFLSYSEETKRYSPGPGVLSLGFSYISSIEVVDVAEPKLRVLCEQLRANTHVGILQSFEVVYVARAKSNAELVSNIAVGSRLSAFTNPMGLVLLSGLDKEELRTLYDAYLAHSGETASGFQAIEKRIAEISKNGFCVGRSSIHNGVASVAAPIYSNNGRQRRIVAAINAVGPEIILDRLGLETKVVEAVVKAAGEISDALPIH
ncbi:IclR family transcriptional regulator [Pusillimonas noertemannii]|uniref:IclR family transcriptional regulator n=1 Tax=Pusillimonas noertemannii TaxID=305977 RepID=UPI0033423882